MEEAINNAVKYSQATKLELQVRDFNHMLEIQIKDNGIGFDPDQVKKGNGLENMRKRAEEMGAMFVIEFCPNQGTQMSLRCNITY
jgi:signal transduction histidine kinase